MKLSKLSPALYLLLTMTIATLFGLTQPTMAIADRTPAIANTPSAIAQVTQNQNPLSQVRGDLAAVWKHHGLSAPGSIAATSNHQGLKDLPGCACPQCSGINREPLLQVG